MVEPTLTSSLASYYLDIYGSLSLEPQSGQQSKDEDAGLSHTTTSKLQRFQSKQLLTAQLILMGTHTITLSFEQRLYVYLYF